ncbi:DUF298-domain-containing protein [Coprinellus micaceus]|uniref:Defective in cullin neddylation protein n=1 Tax=Coprinellus micaceus TaxID=71717 RepID=A0A4Y7TK48_COPMI|nr:DUF298-domain-containing protein [Coprinellus micaceus]
MVDKKMDENIQHFCAITGASARDAKKFLEYHGRLDVAADAYFNNPNAFASSSSKAARPSAPSTSKLNQLFDKYKDLEVDPEDVVMLAVAYELKSPKVGEWARAGWVEGWKALGVDSLPAMKGLVDKLRSKLSKDPQYFGKVYAHTFQFAKTEGARSVGTETAIAFWGLLLPVGLKGGALSHVIEEDDGKMDTGDEGFKDEYIQWWFEFLTEKGLKGVSKDTWMMLRDFIRTIDSKFETYDAEAAWPSTIDDFVEYARNRLES